MGAHVVGLSIVLLGEITRTEFCLETGSCTAAAPVAGVLIDLVGVAVALAAAPLAAYTARQPHPIRVGAVAAAVGWGSGGSAAVLTGGRLIVPLVVGVGLALQFLFAAGTRERMAKIVPVLAAAGLASLVELTGPGREANGGLALGLLLLLAGDAIVRPSFSRPAWRLLATIAVILIAADVAILVAKPGKQTVEPGRGSRRARRTASRSDGLGPASAGSATRYSACSRPLAAQADGTVRGRAR